MKIFCKFPTVNISKRNFWLVICAAKNLIWTALKAIFSIFLFSFHMMYKSQFQKDPYDGFLLVQGHILRLTSLFCVLVFNLIHSVLMDCIIINYMLLWSLRQNFNFVEHTPNAVQSQRYLLGFHFCLGESRFKKYHPNTLYTYYI